MDSFKIRASGAGAIMTNPKGKTVYHYFKDGIEINTASFNKLLLAGKLDGITSTLEEIKGSGLSETCKSYLRKQWIMDTYNREKEYSTPAIRKGLLNEEQGITMLSLHVGSMLTKNDRRFADVFKKGTPDCPDYDEEIVYDIKCSHDIFTFGAAELTSDYEWQLRVYMDLLKFKRAAVAYVLTDTPENLIEGEVNRITYKLQDDSEREMIKRELTKQWTFNDIPSEQRVKLFYIDHDPYKIEELHSRVEQCREFYNNITL